MRSRERGKWCEQPHTQNRNRPEQTDHSVRCAEVLLDVWEERADPDELRPQG
jgi:hypothetical protein